MYICEYLIALPALYDPQMFSEVFTFFHHSCLLQFKEEEKKRKQKTTFFSLIYFLFINILRIVHESGNSTVFSMNQSRMNF